jgi:hypothetical protein
MSNLNRENTPEEQTEFKKEMEMFHRRIMIACLKDVIKMLEDQTL